ncbi:mediator of RNA polymerase II transcription subunit 15-like [Microplitis mediator]|uniref:mediator of RNA polymerase II transcription subunit 15-like n=1 Tax=Microplitis mediator TaxID=375433 RepID=UPI002556EE30|nr:mediator of RNA polymerase II transcription subunit 15-like [Microplitis mediator]
MTTEETSWRTQTFRQSVITKIDEAIQKSGMPTAKNSIEMENHVFQKAKTKEEYLGFVARLILHVREMNSRKNAAGVAAAGGVAPGTQGMQDPIGALQTLARQGTGNNQVMSMAGGGPNPQGMVPQQSANAASNLLQSLNQRPGGPAVGMNMQNMQNKMPGMGMMGGQGAGTMGHMGQMQGMQNAQMINQMGQMSAGNINQQMNQMGQAQMVNQMGPGQMVVGQMQQNITNQMPGQMQAQMGNQIGGPMNAGMQPGPQTINQMGPGQMAQQMGHIQRKPVEMMNAGFPGPRNVTPNQFLRQSPSPSAPSPASLGAPLSNQMVPSPALVPSPSPQHPMMAGQRSIGMAPSPSSSLNTPASMGATSSPQENQAYREKVRQLSKYIDPLRRVITKMGSDGNTDKMSKMKKLLEILSNPAKTVPLETIIKCEVVLEKMDFKRGEGSVGPVVTSMKEHHIFTPLLEAVRANLQSPMANHTLQRTFGPCLEALFGPEIKNLPPPLKKQKVEESVSEIPDVLQGEIARLDQRFKVSLDPAQQNGSKCIQLICWLDDRHLPCVPPVSVSVPSDYPLTPPRCVMAPHEYTTAFLSAVQKALTARITKLPRRFSVSQLLDTWEMSVRQASAPTQTPIAANTEIIGL